MSSSLISAVLAGHQRAFLFACGHDFDLLKLHSLKTKEGSHLNDLILIYEVLGVGAELLDAWLEFATTHAFRNVETKFTSAVLPIVQTKFTNDHFLLIPGRNASIILGNETGQAVG